ncbi:formate/nitrite transporter family protein [Escherichia coli]
MAILYEHIRQDGEKEPANATQWRYWWSAIAAGLSMGASRLAKDIYVDWKERQVVYGESRLYLWFIIVIMARQQLFTENTVTAVLPVMQKPTMSMSAYLCDYGALVLLGNIRTGIAAWHFEYMPIFNEELATHLSKSAWM